MTIDFANVRMDIEDIRNIEKWAGELYANISGLNEWQQDFVYDVYTRLRQHDQLTTTQIEKLRKVHYEVLGG